MICFELFVRPALRKFCGQPDPAPNPVLATLQSEVRVRGDRVTCFPAELRAEGTGFQVRPVDWGGSADLRSTAQANSMCILEPRENAWAAGEVVPVIAWSGF
jgi:molybdopterin molybdotransferase